MSGKYSNKPRSETLKRGQTHSESDRVDRRKSAPFCWAVWIPAVLLLLFTCTAVSASDYEVVESDTQYFDIQPNSLLQLKVGNGNLHINTWDRPGISVRMKKWARAGNRKKAEAKLHDLEIEFDTRDDGILIHELGRGESNPFSGLLRSAGLKKAPSTRVDFDISIPEAIRLKLEKPDGETRLSGIEGDVTINQKKGILFVSDIVTDKLELKLGEAVINVSNVQGPSGGGSYVNFSIDKGEINFQDSNMLRLIARSREADIYLVNNEIKSGEIETDTGDLFFNCNLQPDSQIEALSESGNIYLLLSSRPPSRISAETGIGVIRCSYNWPVEKSGAGHILNYTGNGSNRSTCSFISEIGDIFIQSKWQ